MIGLVSFQASTTFRLSKSDFKAFSTNKSAKAELTNISKVSTLVIVVSGCVSRQAIEVTRAPTRIEHDALMQDQACQYQVTQQGHQQIYTCHTDGADCVINMQKNDTSNVEKCIEFPCLGQSLSSELILKNSSQQNSNEINRLNAGSLWGAAAPLQGMRYGHTVTVLGNGIVLVAGGGYYSAGWIRTDTCYLYDPVQNQWRSAASMLAIRIYHTATLLQNGLVLVTGGKSYSNTITVKCELYDPSTDIWIFTAIMSLGRWYHTATLLQNGGVLVNGGVTSGKLCEIYNPTTNQWTAASPMAVDRYWHTTTLLQNGFVLVTGGNGALTTVEVYNHQTDQWTSVSPLTVGRAGHTATLMKNGFVLVTGGIDALSAAINSCEFYNPLTDTWTSAASLTSGRSYHTANILRSGSILVTGGFGTDFLSSSEIYNPLTDVWTAAASMVQKRRYHTANLLSNGSIIVIGGANSTVMSISQSATCEIYSQLIVTGQAVTAGSSFTSKATDILGTDIAVTWQIGDAADTGTGDIDQNGIFLAKKIGIVTIVAKSGEDYGYFAVTVSGSGALAQIFISGGATTIASGATTPAFTAAGQDVYQNVVSAIFTWATGSTGDTGSAVIDSSTGVLTGHKAGTVTVTAASGTVSKTTTLTITGHMQLQTIVIQGADTVTSGGSTTFTAISQDIYLNSVPAVITWSSGDAKSTGTAEIDATTGALVGHKDGLVTVTAVSGGITSTKTVSVVGDSGVNKVTIGGGQVSVVVGGSTLPFTASAVDVYDNVVSKPMVSWSAGAAGDTGLVGIDPTTGVVTGIKQGAATIRATSNKIQKETTVTVTSAGLSLLQIILISIGAAVILATIIISISCVYKCKNSKIQPQQMKSKQITLDNDETFEIGRNQRLTAIK